MTVRGMTERQLQRREKILSAARKLIAERGYEGVNIRDLAAESGVAPKTLYHQFKNKENLLRTAVEERFRHTYQAIDDADIDKGDTLNVARLAGIPKGVIDRAREILSNLESQSLDVHDQPTLAKHSAPRRETGDADEAARDRAVQLDLFRSANDDLLKELKRLDVDRLTPVEALNLLAELKGRVV